MLDGVRPIETQSSHSQTQPNINRKIQKMRKILAIILATNVALSALGAEVKLSLSKGTITANSATVNYTLTNKNGADNIQSIPQTGWAKLHLISEYDDKWVTIRSFSQSTTTLYPFFWAISYFNLS